MGPPGKRSRPPGLNRQAAVAGVLGDERGAEHSPTAATAQIIAIKPYLIEHARLELAALARRLCPARSRGWPYRLRRVELNALITEQLVALVETALDEHGIQKVIPDADSLAVAWRSPKAYAEIAETVEEANKRAERWREADAPDDLADRVRDLLERQPTRSWDDALRRIAGDAP